MIEIIKDTYGSIFSKLTVSIWLVASIGTVLAGPFGTFDSMSFAMRSFYWPLVTTSSIFLGYLAHALARILVSDYDTTMGQIVAGFLGTVLIATDVFVLNQLVSSQSETAVSFLTLLGWVGFVFCAVILCRSIFIKAILSEIASRVVAPIKTETVVEQDVSKDIPRILARLPEEHHGQIIRLSANDHFVHIVTDAGEHAVRMRLRDAIREMDGIKGSLLHRSHWVAHDAISQKDKAQGKVQIVLRNGDRIPVSRNYREVVESLNLPAMPCAEEERSSASVQ